MADVEPVLEIRGVMCEFGSKRKTRVLHGIDLRIARGEFSPSSVLFGVRKEHPAQHHGLLDRLSTGEVLIAGRSMSHPPTR